MRRWWLVSGLVLAVVLVVLLAALLLGRGGEPADDEGSGDTGGGPSAPGAQAGKAPATGLDALLDRRVLPPPPVASFNGCPPKGDGGDPVLNTLKNRTDSAAWNPIAFADLERLAWPARAERTDYDTWPRDVRAQIDRYNGVPVSVEGYLYAARKQGPESNNCHATGLTDYHMWLTERAGQDRTQSIVVEPTPRILANHPRWTVDRLNDVARNNERVRISGWTMFDPEHPDQVGKTRGTIWEIHPVMQIEVFRGGRWVALDDLK